MADYAGAVAAIRQRLTDNWNTTPIAFQNEAPPQEPWPPIDPVSGNPAPWVMLEVFNTVSEIHAFGAPGDKVWRYLGLIHVHVFVPVNYGAGVATGHAVTIGEIFRGAKFYDDGAGNYIRSWAPSVDGGGSADDVGNTWRVTMTVPFEFFFRG
jgi:hypothetical protein